MDTMTSPMIDLRQVHFSLDSPAGTVKILCGLDLQINAGERVGIVGPSGSGKSSLLMLLAGLEQTSDGQIRVCGQDLHALDETALARFRRHNIGIVFQAFHLIPTMTALENVAVPLELAGDKDAFSRAQAELEAVGLGHRLHHAPSQMSGGEQQRVALARACVARPALVLADEPTGNLDGQTGQAVADLLWQRCQESTLVLVTHDLELASRCDRMVHIADGVVTV